MKYILAISGGVDSVVLLDMWAKTHPAIELIVAHFDHGIRGESGDDEYFVRGLSQKYGLQYRCGAATLGEGASEELARNARYDFLYELARELGATIVTAHHIDDLVETVAINLYRGTGWRGLAVLNRQGIARPLLGMTKTELYEYALAHRLEWREDCTNRDKRYLRNRLRCKTHALPLSTKAKLAQLRTDQVECSKKIEAETAASLRTNPEQRYRYIMMDPMVARELLRELVMQRAGRSLTLPELSRFLLAIKTANRGTSYDIAQGLKVRFTTREFTVLVV